MFIDRSLKSQVHSFVVLFKLFHMRTSVITNVTLQPFSLMHCTNVLLQRGFCFHFVVTVLTFIHNALMLRLLVFNKIVVLCDRKVTLVALVSQTFVLVFLMNGNITLGSCLKRALVTFVSYSLMNRSLVSKNCFFRERRVFTRVASHQVCPMSHFRVGSQSLL